MTDKSAKQAARRPPGEQSPSADEKDADWGFEQSGQEKVIEPKLGIALAICLMLMFGFVFYYKYQSVLSGKSQIIAGSSEDAGEATSQPVIEPLAREDNADKFENHSATQATMTSQVTAGEAQSSDPFAQMEASTAAPESRFASNEASANTENDDSFALGDDTRLSTPSPFGDSEDPEEPAHSGPPPSRFAEGQPFFGEESAPQQSEPAIAVAPGVVEQSQNASDVSTTPASESTWDLSVGQELAAAEETEPDPFGEAPREENDAFDWAPAEADLREPAALESVDVAMPLSPREPEPDPFAALPPLPSEPAEPSPFGEMADTETATPAEQPEDTEWPVFVDANESVGGEASAPASPDPFDTAPELPALPAPADPELAGTENQQESGPAFGQLQQAPPREESPTLEFPAAAIGQPEPKPFATSRSPSAVIGERAVTVKRNVSLWSVSQEAYGTARYVPALAKYNQDRIPDPEKLKVGELILIPPPEVLEGRFPELFRRPGRRDGMVSPAGGSSSFPSQAADFGLFLDPSGRPVYRVGKNDTLSRVAQRCLGRASRWTEILRLNGDLLKRPESLKPGMVLRLPADAARVAVTPDGASSR